MLVRYAATPPGEDWGNACLRYGRWHEKVDYCMPGALLEPCWTIYLLVVSLCAMTALWDQGTVVAGQEDRKEEKGYERVIVADCLDAAAVNLKALIRFQMFEIEKHIEGEDSALATLMGYTWLRSWITDTPPSNPGVRRTSFSTVRSFVADTDAEPSDARVGEAEGGGAEAEGLPSFTASFFQCHRGPGKVVATKSFHQAMQEILATLAQALPDSLLAMEEDLGKQMLGLVRSTERTKRLSNFFSPAGAAYGNKSRNGACG